ncbi:MAG: hypothetical protein IT521_04220 [Burkholderiales bacterium]|nr:hypothetical protein [Burkholderiales bacterium]
MSTLRVLLAAATSPSHDASWTLFDAQDRPVRSGRGAPASWPDADRVEAVLAASAVRLIGVALPPMPADRVASAAAFALEDQLASPAHEQHLVASARRRDGVVEVAIASRALMARLRKIFTRVIAEPAAAPLPSAGGWRWYVSGHEGGFIRKPDGGAFAVGTPEADGPLPAELALALAQAVRVGGANLHVDVAFAVEEARLAAWSAQCGASFKRGATWRWDQDGRALAAATDLLQGEFSRQPTAPKRSAISRFRWTAGFALAALVLHVGATFAQWAWLRVDAWRTASAIVDIARDAGISDAADAEAATIALRRKFTDARHRAGLAAPADALPLLARAAPALSVLAPGTLKTATYSPGTWTFDLAKLDVGVAGTLDRNLSAAGLASLQATNAAGTRLRTTLAPGADRP